MALSADRGSNGDSNGENTMKGVIFNILETLVVEHHGEDTWDDLLDAAGVDGIYTSLGSYEDAEFLKLIQTASDALSVPVPDLVRWYGFHAIPIFYQRYPKFFDAHTDTRHFLLTLNDIIHPEVRKIYPGASVPNFEYHDLPDGGLRVVYSSAKKLCVLAEGLIEGAAQHYDERVSITQSKCTHRGDDLCHIDCTFGA